MPRYNIVIVADEGYVQHAAVMLCSLFNTNKGKVFHIYLLTNGISELNEHRLQRLCSEYGSYIEVIIPEEKLSSHLNIDLSSLPVGQWTTMMYYKLFIPIVLPENIERCLFLDVDMIVNDCIDELYNLAFHDNAVIAACEDMPDCVRHKKRLGLDMSDLYINSGVMVCNLSEWRRLEKQMPLFDYLESVSSMIVNEQDLIAIYFRHKIQILSIRWNMVTFYFQRVPNIFTQYLPELRDAQYKPAIIHYSAPVKPWFRDCNHPYGYLYKKYLKVYAKIVNVSVCNRLNLFNPYGFVYWEQLTIVKRINKYIKTLLNIVDIRKDNDFLMLMR